MRKFGTLIILSMLVLMAFPFAVFAQDGGTISYGQTVTGELTNDNYEIAYQFNGSAGETITIRMNSETENEYPRLDSYLKLLSPDGQEIASDDDGGGNLNSLIGPFTLPADGSYTVIATRYGLADGGSEGAFELTVTLAQINALFLNETVTLELSDSNTMQFFNYTASQAGFYDFSANNIIGVGGVNAMIESPDGTYVNGFYITNDYPSVINPITLEAGQTINITLRYEPNYSGPAPATAGSVRFDLTLGAVSAEPVAYDTDITSVLDDNNPVSYYSFDGNAGNIIRLSADHSGGDFELTLIDPNGNPFNGMSSLNSNVPSVIDPLTLNMSGTYMIVMRRASYNGPLDTNGMIVAYTLRISVTETPLIENGVEYTGIVGERENDYEEVLRYQGVEGQTVRVTLRSLDENYSPSIDIQGMRPVEETTPLATPMPNGGGGGMGGGGIGMGGDFYTNFNSTESGSVSFEFTIPFSGVYLFRVHNAAYSEMGPVAGNFAILIETVE